MKTTGNGTKNKPSLPVLIPYYGHWFYGNSSLGSLWWNLYWMSILHENKRKKRNKKIIKKNRHDSDVLVINLQKKLFRYFLCFLFVGLGSLAIIFALFFLLFLKNQKNAKEIIGLKSELELNKNIESPKASAEVTSKPEITGQNLVFLTHYESDVFTHPLFFSIKKILENMSFFFSWYFSQVDSLPIWISNPSYISENLLINSRFEDLGQFFKNVKKYIATKNIIIFNSRENSPCEILGKIIEKKKEAFEKTHYYPCLFFSRRFFFSNFLNFLIYGYGQEYSYRNAFKNFSLFDSFIETEKLEGYYADLTRKQMAITKLVGISLVKCFEEDFTFSQVVDIQEEGINVKAKDFLYEEKKKLLLSVIESFLLKSSKELSFDITKMSSEFQIAFSLLSPSKQITVKELENNTNHIKDLESEICKSDSDIFWRFFSSMFNIGVVVFEEQDSKEISLESSGQKLYSRIITKIVNKNNPDNFLYFLVSKQLFNKIDIVPSDVNFVDYEIVLLSKDALERYQEEQK